MSADVTLQNLSLSAYPFDPSTVLLLGQSHSMNSFAIDYAESSATYHNSYLKFAHIRTISP
jgi:hypothetical protein